MPDEDTVAKPARHRRAGLLALVAVALILFGTHAAGGHMMLIGGGLLIAAALLVLVLIRLPHLRRWWSQGRAGMSRRQWQHRQRRQASSGFTRQGRRGGAMFRRGSGSGFRSRAGTGRSRTGAGRSGRGIGWRRPAGRARPAGTARTGGRGGTGSGHRSRASAGRRHGSSSARRHSSSARRPGKPDFTGRRPGSGASRSKLRRGRTAVSSGQSPRPGSRRGMSRFRRSPASTGSRRSGRRHTGMPGPGTPSSQRRRHAVRTTRAGASTGPRTRIGRAAFRFRHRRGNVSNGRRHPTATPPRGRARPPRHPVPAGSRRPPRWLSRNPTLPAGAGRRTRHKPPAAGPQPPWWRPLARRRWDRAASAEMAWHFRDRRARQRKARVAAARKRREAAAQPGSVIPAPQPAAQPAATAGTPRPALHLATVNGRRVSNAGTSGRNTMTHPAVEPVTESLHQLAAWDPEHGSLPDLIAALTDLPVRVGEAYSAIADKMTDHPGISNRLAEALHDAGNSIAGTSAVVEQAQAIDDTDHAPHHD